MAAPTRSKVHNHGGSSCTVYLSRGCVLLVVLLFMIGCFVLVTSGKGRASIVSGHPIATATEERKDAKMMR